MTIANLSMVIDSGGAELPAQVAVRGFAITAAGSFQSTGSIQGGIITAANMQSASPLADVVDYDTLGWISWELNFGENGSWQFAALSSNTRYTILEQPALRAGRKLLESYLYIGCVSALNRQDQNSTFDSIWGKFATRLVERVDGSALGYYRGSQCNRSCPPAFSAEALVAEGNGRCGGWADFLDSVMRTQGVRLSQWAIFPDLALPLPCAPDPAQICAPDYRDPGFIVSNVAFGEAQPLCAGDPYPFKIDYACQGFYLVWGALVSVNDLPGIPGQDNPNPPTFFPDHAVVKYAGKIYDPSYGVGPFLSEADYEAGAIAGYLRATVIAVEQEPGEIQILGCALVARPNDEQFDVRFIEQLPE